MCAVACFRDSACTVRQSGEVLIFIGTSELSDDEELRPRLAPRIKRTWWCPAEEWNVAIRFLNWTFLDPPHPRERDEVDTTAQQDLIFSNLLFSVALAVPIIFFEDKMKIDTSNNGNGNGK